MLTADFAVGSLDGLSRGGLGSAYQLPARWGQRVPEKEPPSPARPGKLACAYRPRRRGQFLCDVIIGTVLQGNDSRSNVSEPSGEALELGRLLRKEPENRLVAA